MKSEFTFSENFEKLFGGCRVWITPYKEEETPDLPILDLGMDITLSCRITCCLTNNETRVQDWKSTPIRILGTICKRRIVVDSRGQSHMIYTVAPSPTGTEDIRLAMHKALDGDACPSE
jgi:hypothetical protein